MKMRGPLTTEHMQFARAAAATYVEKFDDWIHNFTWKHLQLEVFSEDIPHAVLVM